MSVFVAFENATCPEVLSAGEGDLDVIEDGVDFLDFNPEFGFLLDLGAGVGSNLNLLLGDLSRAPNDFLPNLSLSLRLNLLLLFDCFALFLSATFSELDSDFSAKLRTAFDLSDSELDSDFVSELGSDFSALNLVLLDLDGLDLIIWKDKSFGCKAPNLPKLGSFNPFGNFGGATLN